MKKRRLSFRPLSTLWACLVYLFLYLPIFVVIAYSFNGSSRNVRFEGFTFSWYVRMFDNRQLMEAFQNTVFLAVVSTLISVVLGTLCAVGLYRFEFKLKSAISTALYIPIVIPEIVFGISLLVFFSSLDIPQGMLTLVIAHVTFSLPFVVITVRSRLAGFDRSLEEAAQDLGANGIRTFFRVTLPLITPGVISGALLALTLSLDDVVVSTFTAGRDTTLPLKIQSMVKRGVTPDVNALSTVMIIGVFLILILSNLIQGRQKKNKKKEG